MNINEETEIKKEFQLERVILFSDAVFAIIITIMVLDIRLPDDLRHGDPKAAKHVLIQLIPKVMAYGVSFFLVSKFWRSHLKMFSLLRDYDSKLLGYNLLYLFSVSFFPFAVTLMSGNVDLDSMQYTWAGYTYAAIFLFCTFSQTLLATYLVKNRHKLCFDTNNLEKILKYRAVRLNFFFIPGVIAIIAGLSYFAFKPVYAIYVLAFYGIMMRRLMKIYYPERIDKSPTLSRLFRGRKIRLINQSHRNEEAGV